jgi:putative DNA primase/helicase
MEDINNLINDSFEANEPPKENNEVKGVRQHLDPLLKELNPIDFHQEAKLSPREKLSMKHYLILTIKYILLCAKKINRALCSNNDRVYFFNGSFWEVIDKEDLCWFLAEAAKRLGTNPFDADYYEYKHQLFKQFRSQANLPKPEKNRKIVLINLKNGTYECGIEGSHLREFDKKDFLTHQLPFNLDPEATAPRFKTFLNMVLPEIENQMILAESFASSFIPTSTLKFEKVLILFGQGANGKSVIFEIINALLGRTNLSSYSISSLTDTNGYYRAMLADKLLNYGSEMNVDMDNEMFKLLASGEPVEARYIFGKPFTLRNYAKLAFNCNILPKGVEHTDGFFRRFLILPFNVTIPEDKQDKELAKKIIEEELSGIFNWLLEGLGRLIEHKKFTYSKSAEDVVIKYKTETDNVQQFLIDEHWVESDRYIVAKELSSCYHDYCVQYRYRSYSHINFLNRLRSLGIRIEKRNVGQVVFLQPNTPKVQYSIEDEGGVI